MQMMLSIFIKGAAQGWNEIIIVLKILMQKKLSHLMPTQNWNRNSNDQNIWSQDYASKNKWWHWKWNDWLLQL